MQRPVRTLESPVAFSLDERDRGKARPLVCSESCSLTLDRYLIARCWRG
jgi:hypothetical protein